MNPALALRKAVHARLATDPELLSLLGGPEIHDEPPRAAAGPHVVHGRWESEDASTAERQAARHGFDLVVWAGQTSGTAAALAVAGRIEQLLHDAPLVPEGQRLVFLYRDSTVALRDERSKLPRVRLSFRALTEAA